VIESLFSWPGTTSPLQNGQPWKPDPAGPQPRPESDTRTTPPRMIRAKGAMPVGEVVTVGGTFKWASQGLRSDQTNIRCSEAYVRMTDTTWPDGYSKPSVEEVLAQWQIPQDALEEINAEVP
jgi:hypothetical protein